jgi:hypothetical protein
MILKNKLLLLKPCKYRYIDDNKNFDAVKKVYGFIAEEVKQVLPQAVDDTTDQLIPNIYKLGNIENDILTIEKELEIDIEYTIYLKNGEDLENATKEEIEVVAKIENDTYGINKTYEGLKDVFVYGKIEKNLNSLKKEYFHALTISSVQELYKAEPKIMHQQQTVSNFT